MNMEVLLLPAILLVILVVIRILVTGVQNGRKWQYRRHRYLLSNAERSFYGVLVQATGSEHLVFAKVRIADVLEPVRGMGRSNRQSAFNAISSKHFDFLLCDPSDCSIQLAVELDDTSHDSERSRKRDRLVNRACESAGLQLLRVKAARSYAATDIRNRIDALLSPPETKGEQ